MGEWELCWYDYDDDDGDDDGDDDDVVMIMMMMGPKVAYGGAMLVCFSYTVLIRETQTHSIRLNYVTLYNTLITLDI